MLVKGAPGDISQEEHFRFGLEPTQLMGQLVPRGISKVNKEWLGRHRDCIEQQFSDGHLTRRHGSPAGPTLVNMMSYLIHCNYPDREASVVVTGVNCVSMQLIKNFKVRFVGV